jgi:hypothetical protein
VHVAGVYIALPTVRRRARDRIQLESDPMRELPAHLFAAAGAWHIVDFDVERYRERLYRLHLRMQREGPLVVRGYSILIEASKP